MPGASERTCTAIMTARRAYIDGALLRGCAHRRHEPDPPSPSLLITATFTWPRASLFTRARTPWRHRDAGATTNAAGTSAGCARLTASMARRCCSRPPDNDNADPEMLKQRRQRVTDAVAAAARNDIEGPWMLKQSPGHSVPRHQPTSVAYASFSRAYRFRICRCHSWFRSTAGPARAPPLSATYRHRRRTAQSRGWWRPRIRFRSRLWECRARYS
jgi:hypothetical protein